MSKFPRRTVKSWPSEVVCSELVQVLAKSRTDAGVPAMAAILEAIGETEAVLSCDAPMRRNRAIEVNARSWSFRASVAGCRKQVALGGYVILVKFENSFRWTAAAFCPEHMLDLRTLAEPDPASQPAPPRVFAAGRSY